MGALLLICSLLAHELAHAVVARGAGVEVDGLTLWMFGGVARLRSEPPTARADLRIAAIGPATSVALAAALGLLWLVLAALGADGLVMSVLAWLAGINLVLGLFNLVPGAPLDGGRVLRAVLWSTTGDRYRAAAFAAAAGQAVGYGLVALGLLVFLSSDPVGGLWLVVIGWFVQAAARAEHAATVSEHVLGGVSVRDVMSTEVETGSAEVSVAEFITRNVLRGHHSAYPVVGRDGVVEGLVTLRQLRGVAPDERAGTPVRDVCVPLDGIATCAPTDLLAEVLPRVTRESGLRALVFDEGRLVGIVTPADVARTLDARALMTSAGG
jgi:Zn-dependent protease